ncbi:MAG: uroporphyrinogen decarboxylase family protein [Anaerolineae bacterium]
MTKRERIDCVFAHEEPDRVPVFDWVSNQALLAHFAGRPLTLDNAAEVIPAASAHFLDLAPLWYPATTERHTSERGLVIEGADWFTHWVVQWPFATDEELVAYIGRYIEELRAWQPAPPHPELRAEQERLIARYGGSVVAGTVGEAQEATYNSFGLERFIYLLSDRPDLAQAWLDAQHAKTIRELECGCSVGFDPRLYPVMCLTADIGFKGSLLFSPAYLRRSGYFRRIAEVCEVCHGFGIKVLLHTDGELTSILPDLVATGIDALHPIDTGAGMDLRTVKDAYGDRLVLVGGIDGNITLPMGTPEQVRQETLAALATGAPGGGYIAASSSAELFDSMPLENILAMLDTVWQYGRYPLSFV